VITKDVPELSIILNSVACEVKSIVPPVRSKSKLAAATMSTSPDEDVIEFAPIVKLAVFN
jgi:hypothetical protein